MTTPEPPVTTSSTDAATPVPADLQDERLIASQGVAGWLSSTWERIKSGDLGSLPVVIGLIIIWGVFYALNPAFLSSRNLVNLTTQMVPIGTLALGVVLVLLLGEIDLSIDGPQGPDSVTFNLVL